MGNQNYKSIFLSEFNDVTFGFLDRHNNYSIELLAKKNKLTKIVKLNQIHSNNVHVILNNRDSDVLPDGDSLITNKKGLGLGIYTADCVPILLFDKQNNVVSAVHAGWKGSLSNILSETLENMNDHFNSDPQNIYAVIGPCIGGCCYEVEKDVVLKFVENYSKTDSFIYPLKNSKFILDLRKFNCEILRNHGVKNLEIINKCTKCDYNYYSYRREGNGVGSQLSFIGMINC